MSDAHVIIYVHNYRAKDKDVDEAECIGRKKR